MGGTCRGLVIGAASSGSGKTSIALGLARALAREAGGVRCFKVGPDYLDPTYLRLASGQTCYNLDAWMTGEAYVRALYARKTRGVAHAVVEGVMGLYDGPDAERSAGSTADMARILGLPVLLVVDARSMGRSLAAVVKGFCELEPNAEIGGVIANRVGSERHAAILRSALASADLPPLAGAIPDGALPELPSRHLGLVTATASLLPPATLDALADGCLAHIDPNALPWRAAPSGAAKSGETADASPRRVRVAVAFDDAFHFYYPDNLEALEAAGAELCRFSPEADAALPPDLGALLLGGGYPEARAEALAANETMREAVRAFARSGRPVLAECGGLMYLCDALIDRNGRRHAMAGAIPARTRMLARRKRLGYVEGTLRADGPLGAAGSMLRGHEFHYSEIVSSSASGWEAAYRLCYRGGETDPEAGFRRGAVVAGYPHWHLASRPGAAGAFLAYAAGGGRSARAACPASSETTHE